MSALNTLRTGSPAALGLTICLGAVTIGLALRALAGRRLAWRRVIIFSLAAVALLGAGGSVAGTYYLAYRIVHPITHLPEEQPEAYGITDYQAVDFLSADGLRLRGWYIPTRNGAAVILVHGHAANRAHMLPDAAALARAGYGVLLYDSRNCGESQLARTTLGITEVDDVRGALDFVLQQPGVDPDRIGLMGHSLGGATVIMAAARLPQVRAVVALSAYSSLDPMIEAFTGLPAPVFGPLLVGFAEREAGIRAGQVRPIDDIGAISPRPILLIHGAQDNLVPADNAQALYAAAAEPKSLYLIPNAGHSALLAAGGPEYVQRLTAFMDQSLAAPQAAEAGVRASP